MASICPQACELVVGERVAGPQVPLATQVELDELDVEPLDRADGLEDLQALATTSGPVPSPAITPIVWVTA